jgi:hypothetical protein
VGLNQVIIKYILFLIKLRQKLDGENLYFLRNESMAQRSIIIMLIIIIYYDIYIYEKIEAFKKESDLRGGQKPKRTLTPSPIHGLCMVR